VTITGHTAGEPVEVWDLRTHQTHGLHNVVTFEQVALGSIWQVPREVAFIRNRKGWDIVR